MHPGSRPAWNEAATSIRRCSTRRSSTTRPRSSGAGARPVARSSGSGKCGPPSGAGWSGTATTSTTEGTGPVEDLNEEYLSQLGATLVALLQRSQVAEEEGLLVEVLEIEAALATLRAELTMMVERRRGFR